MGRWAIDLGTTNTGVARWDTDADRPRLVALERVCRTPDGDEHLEAPRLVRSAAEPLADPGFWARLSSRGPLAGLALWGRLGWIGREAVERSRGEPRPAFVPSFKPALGLDALRILARANGRSWTARDITRLFLRELLVEVRHTTGERVRDLVITTPVDAYEAYRAELLRIAHHLGVRDVRFVDEPVAAAIGYDIGPRSPRHVLVVDFGGGSLDLALVRLTPRELEQGTCAVLAKQGRAIGGDLVDRWLLDAFARDLGYPAEIRDADSRWAFWHQLMLEEARRVKEAVFFREVEPFYLTPPEEMRDFEARIRGEAGAIDVSRDRVREILTARGLYRHLEECIEGVLRQAHAQGIGQDDIQDVLMVGGSTLLPDVYALFEARFGRDRVRAWKPFEAVAYGACAYAAGRFAQSDFIVHDYALVTHDATTHEAQQTIIVPRGTRVPTAPDLWKRRLVPTCSLGEPENIFKLVVSEVGVASGDERFFAFDQRGGAHKVGGTGEVAVEPLVVPLNEANPTLGRLDPPHPPSDRRPRLEIAFGVNADRYLIATVRDLKTRKLLMRGEPVVRLL